MHDGEGLRCRVVIADAVQQPVHAVEQQLAFQGDARAANPSRRLVDAHHDVRVDRLLGLGETEAQYVRRGRLTAVLGVQRRHPLVVDQEHADAVDGPVEAGARLLQAGADPPLVERVRAARAIEPVDRRSDRASRRACRSLGWFRRLVLVV
jgi:hypothetical protein